MEVLHQSTSFYYHMNEESSRTHRSNRLNLNDFDPRPPLSPPPLDFWSQAINESISNVSQREIHKSSDLSSSPRCEVGICGSGPDVCQWDPTEFTPTLSINGNSTQETLSKLWANMRKIKQNQMSPRSLPILPSFASCMSNRQQREFKQGDSHLLVFSFLSLNLKKASSSSSP